MDNSMAFVGWIATILVTAGFGLNAWKQFIPALLVWIVGDILWIWYDFAIANPAHAVLSTVIIGLNIRGLIKADRIQWSLFINDLKELTSFNNFKQK